MTGLTPQFSALCIIVVDPLSSPITIRCKKPFRFCLWSSEKTAFDVSWLEFMRNPISLFLHHTHESWSNDASYSTSSNFTGLPSRSLSLVSKSPLLKRRNQYSYVFIYGACSPYASHRNRCPSAALFFKLKQKSSSTRKCCFVGAKVEMLRAQRRRVVYTSAK